MSLRKLLPILCLLTVVSVAVAQEAPTSAEPKGYRFFRAIGAAGAGALDRVLDLTADKYGNLYVVQNPGGSTFRIDIFQRKGTFYGNFMESAEETEAETAAAGGGAKAKPGEIRRPSCIATDKDDRLLIGTEADGVLVFDAEGNYAGKLGEAQGLTKIRALRTDPAGNVYVSSPSRTGSLFRYDSSGKLTLEYAREVVRQAPESVAVDEKGFAYLVDAEAGIVRITPEGKRDPAYKSPIPGYVTRDDVAGIRLACDAKGNVVAAYPSSRQGGSFVAVLTPQGAVAQKAKQIPGTVEAALGTPDGFAYIAAEGLFSQNPAMARQARITRVMLYKSDGTEVLRYGADAMPGRFSKIACLAPISSALGGDLVVLDRTGVMHQMGKDGQARGIFAHAWPCIIAVGPDRGAFQITGAQFNLLSFRGKRMKWQTLRAAETGGSAVRVTDAVADFATQTLYCVDQASQRIVKLDFDFNYKGEIRTFGTNDKFRYPSGVALSPDANTLYVTEFGGTQRLLALDAKAGTLKSELAKGLQAPMVPRVGPDGGIFVVEMRGKRVVKFSPTGEKLAEFTEAGKNKFESPAAVAVGPDGTVYIGENSTSLVYLFVPGQG